MSQENFVNYYTNWVRQPEQKEAAEKLDAIKNEAKFGEFALSQVEESGLDFNEQDIIDVMESSMSKVIQGSGVKIDDLAQADELAQEEMGATAGGGYRYNAYARSRRSLISTPTVKIYSMGSFSAPKVGGGTIMCCW